MIIFREGIGIGDAGIVEARPVPSRGVVSCRKIPLSLISRSNSSSIWVGDVDGRHILDVRYPFPVLLRGFWVLARSYVRRQVEDSR